jgi:hypothetical protein
MLEPGELLEIEHSKNAVVGSNPSPYVSYANSARRGLIVGTPVRKLRQF